MINNDGSWDESEEPGEPERERKRARRLGEQRSRNGCLTCRRRRKKCPEDVRVWSDGTQACSVCHQRGEVCHMPAAGSSFLPPASLPPPAYVTTMEQPQQYWAQVQSHQEQNQRQQAHFGKTKSSSQQRNAGSSSSSASTSSSPPFSHSFLNTATVATTTTTPSSFHDSSSTAPVTPSYDQAHSRSNESHFAAAKEPYEPVTHSSNPPCPVVLPHQQEGPPPAFVESSIFDDFFRDFVDLSGHFFPSEMGGAASIGADFLGVFPARGVEQHRQPQQHLPSTAQSQAPSAGAVTQESGASTSLTTHYEDVVGSDELDQLMEKYSKLYERFWQASVQIRDEAVQQRATQELYQLSRSSRACRAATVAVCLVFHYTLLEERARNGRQLKYLQQISGDTLLHDDDDDDDDNNDDRDNVAVGSEDNETQLSKQQLKQQQRKQLHQLKRHPAKRWLHYAYHEYKRQQGQLTLLQRAFSLSNIHAAIQTLDCDMPRDIMVVEMVKELEMLDIDTRLLLRAHKRGSITTILVLSLAYTTIAHQVGQGRARSPIPGTIASLGEDEMVELSGGRGQRSPRRPWEGHEEEDFDYFEPTCVTAPLVLCFKAASELGADIEEGKPLNRAEAQHIERLLRKSNALAPVVEGGVAGMRVHMMNQMLRQACLIHLYQAVFRYGPTSPVIRKCLEEILDLCRLIPPEPPSTPPLAGMSGGDDHPSTVTKQQQRPREAVGITSRGRPGIDLKLDVDTGEMAAVWILACTVCLRAEDRVFCMDKLENMGNDRMTRNNVEAIRELWKTTDETGHTVDWHDFVKQRGLSISYG